MRVAQLWFVDMAAKHERVMNPLVITYDAVRGGFYLHFNRIDREIRVPVLGRLIDTYLSSDSLIVGVESFWDRGGMRLSGFYSLDWDALPSGEIQLSDDGGQMSPVIVRQSPQYLDVFFHFSPFSSDPTHHDSKLAISIWMIDNEVGGLRFGFASLSAKYPFTCLRMKFEDFK